MGYIISKPVRLSFTVGKFTLEISDRYVVILHLLDIYREFECLFFPSLTPRYF